MLATASTVDLVTDNNYFNRLEVSNSDLSWLKKQFMPDTRVIDIEKAYKFGSLIDAMITEPHRVDRFRFTVDDVQYTQEEFQQARQMERAFMADPLCVAMLKQANPQAVMAKLRQFDVQGYKFELMVRCKWDLWMKTAGWGGDIKSTAAATEKQFIEAARYFDYDRQRAWYMDIAGSNQDILVGISKVNNKIFKIPIRRDDDFYKSGRAKYEDLVFKWWYLFAA